LSDLSLTNYSVAIASLKGKPFLFRSYDHPEPAPNGTSEKGAHLNPGPAADVAIWKVGRATSAAPGWFKPMIIEQQTYIDGAMAMQNNPVKIAYNEVKQLHPAHEPVMIISIGTNPKRPKTESPANANPTFMTFGVFKDTFKGYKQSLSESYKTHQDFRDEHDFPEHVDRTVQDDKAIYFRFDVPSNLPFKDVKLCDWHGTDGHQTKQAISESTLQYLARAEINQELIRCARHLVDIRRRRVKTARWETFALDARLYYFCPESRSNAACKDLRFDSRYHLRQHAFERHGFTQKIPCKFHMYPASDNLHQSDVQTQNTTRSQQPSRRALKIEKADWTCFRDDCEEEVLAFEEREDFKNHFAEKHDNMQPLFMTDRELEDWLERGRKWLEDDNSERSGVSRRGTADASHWNR